VTFDGADRRAGSRPARMTNVRRHMEDRFRRSAADGNDAAYG
jgi:hypothetical protein